MTYTPSEFRQLSCDKQIHPLTTLFMQRRTVEPLWVNRKMNPSYFKLRRFFDKIYDEESPQFMNMLYESLYYDEAKPMSVTEFIRDARCRKQRLIDIKIKECMTGRNEKVTVEDVLGE